MKSLAVQQMSYGQDNYSFVVVPVEEGQESIHLEQGSVVVVVADEVSQDFFKRQSDMIAFQDELSALFNNGNKA